MVEAFVLVAQVMVEAFVLVAQVYVVKVDVVLVAKVVVGESLN